MPAIIKNELRVMSLDACAYSILNNPTYFFLSGVSPWANELSPPMPLDNATWENNSLRDIFGIKRILPTDVVASIPRINWILNSVYDFYDHTVDMINDRNPLTGDFYRFYVVTDEFNVYKCISNNYGAASVVMPSGTNPEPFRTPDGYIWKYMYTIRSQDAFKFMTENWIPCYTLNYDNGSAQWNSQASAIPGTIDSIILNTNGIGYSIVNPPTVTIVGDGVGAEASPIVNPASGEIVDIVITNHGSNYTNATVSISSASGTGATARAIIGPRKGHGHDPRVELGASYMMIKTTIDGSEGDVLPTNIEFRTSGIIHLPGTNPTGSLGIKLINSKANLFTSGETITGSESGTTATISHVDIMNGILYVKDIAGVFIITDMISSNGSNASEIESITSGFLPLDTVVSSGSDMIKNTGKILYIANREKITRQADQREDIIAVLSF